MGSAVSTPLKDYAQGKILPEFTDERLNSPDSSYKNDVQEDLLKVPADQRQNLMAEAGRRERKFEITSREARRWIMEEQGWL